jgi:hypothetical protein
MKSTSTKNLQFLQIILRLQIQAILSLNQNLKLTNMYGSKIPLWKYLDNFFNRKKYLHCVRKNLCSRLFSIILTFNLCFSYVYIFQNLLKLFIDYLSINKKFHCNHHTRVQYFNPKNNLFGVSLTHWFKRSKTVGLE